MDPEACTKVLPMHRSSDAGVAADAHATSDGRCTGRQQPAPRGIEAGGQRAAPARAAGPKRHRLAQAAAAHRRCAAGAPQALETYSARFLSLFHTGPQPERVCHHSRSPLCCVRRQWASLAALQEQRRAAACVRLRGRDRHESQPIMLPAAGTVQLRGPASVSAGLGCGAQGTPQRAQARLQGTADLAWPRALVTVHDAARCRALGSPQRGERPGQCQWLPLQPQDPLAQGRSDGARSPQQARRTPCAPGQRQLCAAAGGG